MSRSRLMEIHHVLKCAHVHLQCFKLLYLCMYHLEHAANNFTITTGLPYY